MEESLIDLRLFGDRSFRAALLILLLGLGMVGGSYLFVTQYLQLVENLSPVVAGLWLLPPAFALIVSSMLTPILARKVRPGYVAGGALAIAAVGYAMLALVDSVAGLPVLVAGFVLVYVGTGPTIVLGTELVVATAPREKAGAAAALSETSQEFGIALGLAMLGVLGTAVYRSDLAETADAGVPAAVAELAREALANAKAAVEGLPREMGDALLATARKAFTNGLNLISVVCAVISAGLAVAAVALLRHVPASGQSEDDTEDDTTEAEPADS